MNNRLPCALLLLVSPAGASTVNVGFDPLSRFAPVGGSAAVNLVISGLGNQTAPSLGDYGLQVDFNSAILAFNHVSFGDPVLGNQLDLFGLGDIQGSQLMGPGLVRVFEVSLDASSAVDSMQPASFVLATLTFDVIGAGTSALSIGIQSLGDSSGNALAAGTTIGAVTGVPEPGTLAMFGLGLAAAVHARRRFRGGWLHATSSRRLHKG